MPKYFFPWLQQKQKILQEQSEEVINTLRQNLAETEKVKVEAEEKASKVLSLEEEVIKLRKELAEALEEKAATEEELSRERQAREEVRKNIDYSFTVDMIKFYIMYCYNVWSTFT